MTEEEFITEFYSCDNEEQFLKVLYHNMKSLMDKNQKYKEVIDKAILELANIDGNLSNSQLSDRICNLIDILSEVK